MHPVFGGVYTTHKNKEQKVYLQEMATHGYRGVATIPSGLLIDTSDSSLVCSPDDIVVLPTGEQGLVQYKCLYKAAKESLTPEEGAVGDMETSVLS